MNEFVFQKASKKDSRLRMVLEGLPKSGKTWTSLKVASYFPALPGRGRGVGVIDTEHGSARKYSDQFNFEVVELSSYSPETYIGAIRAAEAQGFDVIVIDSLSHEWKGKDGALQQVDQAAKRSQSGNTFRQWADVTPRHDAVIEAILDSPCHIIATLRVKATYVVEQDLKGKAVPRKVGLAPIQRPDGVEYEFDVIGHLDQENTMVVEGRCSALNGQVIQKPGEYLARTLISWLQETPAAARAANPNGPTLEARQEWIALCNRAARVYVPYRDVALETINQADLRLEYANLAPRVRMAETRAGVEVKA